MATDDLTLDNRCTAIAVDVLIVGAGFSGLCMAIRLQQSGQQSFLVIEKANDVGGTWRDNRYPGCACDVPSHLYSFSFAPNSDWSRLYPTQPELLSYLQNLLCRFHLQRHLAFNKVMESAYWDETNQCWHVSTQTGEKIRARILISAVGELHCPAIPDLPNITRFTGAVFHSAQWPKQLDLAGRRIAVVGTGASAIQIVPELASLAKQLFVFQRTAPWVLPKRDRPIAPWEQFAFRYIPAYRSLFRHSLYWRHELRVLGLLGHDRLLRRFESIVRRHIARSISDPRLRELLTPNYRMGCKRVLISDDYYPTLARGNVEVVVDRISDVKARSIVTVDGAERSVDAIIFATGFSVTAALATQQITGRNGMNLADAWRNGVRSYYGICLNGFPNYFMLFGPNTGLAHNSIVLMIEAQANYIVKCIKLMRRMRAGALNVRGEAEERFDRQLQARMMKTVWQTGGCRSWYHDSAGRNVAMWPGFTFEYRWRIRRPSPSSFEWRHVNQMPAAE